MPEPTYREGDWFAVPLWGGGFATVIIARMMPRKEGVLLGYFFGPRRDSVPTLDELGALSASDATLVERFGDLGILDGAWPLVGHADKWNRGAWPTPAFGRLEELTERAFKVIYDDGDPNRLLREERIDPSELASLPKDGLSGAGAVERILTRLLS
jgi:Immunity protein 26